MKKMGGKNMNATIEVLFNRFSCREFTDKMPDDEQLRTIARAAVASPSGMNRQPWRVIVIRDQSLIQDMDDSGMRILSEMEDKTTYERFMARGGTLFYHTPTMFVIPMEPDTELDCGIVSENIAIAADGMGLNSLICGMARLPLGGNRGEEFKKRMNFPEGYEFGMAVLVGYAAAPGKPHEPDMSKVTFVD